MAAKRPTRDSRPPSRVAMLSRLDRIVALATDLSRELGRSKCDVGATHAMAIAIARDSETVRRALKRVR